MKKVIVTTTINPPTEAIRKFDALEDWELIVIGDQKTPKDYKLKRGRYYSPEEQQKLLPDLSNAIGWNCIQRRNIGFVLAHQQGADIISSVDDDNIPLPGWGGNLMLGRPVMAYTFTADLPAFDPILVAGYPKLWHRGYPLQLLAKRGVHVHHNGKEELTADIQADFWNGDPDIDAICRMEHAPECEFDPSYFPIASYKPSPFNSQNTFLLAKVLPHYFMMCEVGRMDDIWGGYHAQAQGFKVIYGAASVVQKRNDHDLIKDMKGEYLGYEHNLDIVKAVPTDKACVLRRLTEKALRAFEIYQRQF